MVPEGKGKDPGKALYSDYPNLPQVQFYVRHLSTQTAHILNCLNLKAGPFHATRLFRFDTLIRGRAHS